MVRRGKVRRPALKVSTIRVSGWIKRYSFEILKQLDRFAYASGTDFISDVTQSRKGID